MKSATKKQIQDSSAKHKKDKQQDKRLDLSPQVNSQELPDQSSAEKEQFWQAEVEELMGQKFDSMESLVETIIDRTFARLGFQPEVDEKVALRELLTSSPDVVDSLKKLL